MVCSWFVICHVYNCLIIYSMILSASNLFSMYYNIRHTLVGYIRGRLLHWLVYNTVGRWFPPGTPVSSTRKLISSSSSFHRLDMTLAVAEALTPNNANPILVYNIATTELYWVGDQGTLHNFCCCDSFSESQHLLLWRSENRPTRVVLSCRWAHKPRRIC